MKLLVTSNFFFSHSVFKRLVLQTRKNQGLFGKGLIYITNRENLDWFKFNPFPEQALGFTSMKSFENTVGKGEIAGNFFHGVFYPFRELFAIVSKSKIVVCKVFQFRIRKGFKDDNLILTQMVKSVFN